MSLREAKNLLRVDYEEPCPDRVGFVFVGFVRFYTATNNANHLSKGILTCGIKIRLEFGIAKRNAQSC